MEDVNTRFSELQQKIKDGGSYFSLSKEEKKEYQKLKSIGLTPVSVVSDSKENPNTKLVQSQPLEAIKRSLWEKIKDGKARSFILAIDENGDAKTQLVDLKDRMIEGKDKGYVQNFIDKL